MSEPSKDRLLAWLPEIYHDPVTAGFLKIIEGMFDDLDARVAGLPDTVAPLSDFFDKPEQNPLLQFLSTWVDLTFSEDWTLNQRRDILAQILPLYKKRGTLEGLKAYLKLYVGSGVEIKDDLAPLQVGVISRLGMDTILGGFPPETPPLQVGMISEVGKDAIIGGFPPYFFLVRAAVAEGGPKALLKKRKAIVEILEREKPAHTWYRLFVRGPTFQIGDQETATLGINTII